MLDVINLFVYTIMDKIHANFLRKCKEAKSLKNLSNENMLLLYGYYKQATIGDCNTPQPYIYQFEKRALWDAWNSIKGTTKEEAMKMYIYYADLYLD